MYQEFPAGTKLGNSWYLGTSFSYHRNERKNVDSTSFFFLIKHTISPLGTKICIGKCLFASKEKKSTQPRNKIITRSRFDQLPQSFFFYKSNRTNLQSKLSAQQNWAILLSIRWNRLPTRLMIDLKYSRAKMMTCIINPFLSLSYILLSLFL